MEYKCYKCFYITNKKINLTNHFNRKKKCSRNINCYYTDEQINNFNEEQLKKDEKTSYCDICNKNFSTVYNFNKHNRNVHKEDLKNIKINIKNNIENNMNNITNNINNIKNIKNINIINNNIINLTMNFTKPIPFNEDWNLSEIENTEKPLIFYSSIMYTKLLQKILENELNLNVIIDKDSSSGLVYTKNSNNNDEYINMNIENIVEKSMEKINKHLHDIYNDIIANFPDLYYKDECKKLIDEKYKNFINDKNIKKKVENYFTDIYIKTNDKALQIMKDINENNLVNGY
jgi:hypothetical protein